MSIRTTGRRGAAGVFLPLVGFGLFGCAALPQPSAEPPPLQPAPAATPESEADGEPSMDAAAAEIFPAPRCDGYVALTFDDGPSPNTPELLELLDRAGVPATFFNIGRNMAKYPDAVVAQAAAGHQFGNHTYSHADLLTIDPETIAEEMASTSALHEELVGEPFEFFRPPFGNTDPAIREEAERQGMVEALWTTDSKDFEAGSVEQIVEKSTGMEAGGVLLVHEFPDLTLQALPQIINHYHERGLCFGRLAVVDEPLRSDSDVDFFVGPVAP
ncbi:polysaccharide deacetylase family protein [Egicoccus sp. AB-alg6-2]|uniref:polysaccharide deacetylase family protein n=1 Tax=Egicoccus sp. AB-alg6-2 TaxID=3242692 RepID=UPI00359D928D